MRNARDNRPTILLDLDGVVRDTSQIIHLIKDRPKKYDEFYASCSTCPPIQRVVNLVKERFYDPDWHVIITTGQPERFRIHNESWVTKYVGRTECALMRRDDDHRKAPEVKYEMLSDVRAHGYNVLEAWDDDPAVVAMYGANCVDTHWVWNSTRFN